MEYTVKMDRKYSSFISALKSAKVRIIRDEAFLNISQLSSVLSNVVLKLKINEDSSLTIEQTEGAICSEEQIARLVKDIDGFSTLGYAEKYIVGELEFKDSNGDLCYIEVEQLTPFDKLRSILDDLDTETPLEVFKDVKDTNRVNSLIDSLFDDLDFNISEEITKQGIGLISDMSKKIDDYFENVEEVQDNKIPDSYLMNSFNKMKQEQMEDLKKRAEEKEKELIKLSSDLKATTNKIKKGEADLANLVARLKVYDIKEEEFGYSFAVSQAINNPIDVTEKEEDLLKKVSNSLQMPYDMLRKLITDSSYKIYIKSLEEEDNMRAYDKLRLIDHNAQFNINEDGVILYRGKLKWHDLVDLMISKGFKQDPELDKEIGNIEKEVTE